MNRIGDFSHQFGLGTIAQELGVEFTPHRAVDDAYATMKVAEAMCKAENLSFAQLLEKYRIRVGRTENLEVTQNTSEAFENYRAAREQAKEERERKRAAFHVYADKEKRKRAKEGKLKDKVFCFSHALELQTELAQSLLQSAFAQAARITFRAEECDLYVCFETESGPRLQSVQARGARVLTPEAFGKLCED